MVIILWAILFIVGIANCDETTPDVSAEAIIHTETPIVPSYPEDSKNMRSVASQVPPENLKKKIKPRQDDESNEEGEASEAAPPGEPAEEGATEAPGETPSPVDYGDDWLASTEPLPEWDFNFVKYEKPEKPKDRHYFYQASWMKKAGTDKYKHVAVIISKHEEETAVCNGAIISPLHILTVAQGCIIEYTDNKTGRLRTDTGDIRVITGKHTVNPDDKGGSIVVEIIYHPQLKEEKGSVIFNAAILVLKEGLKLQGSVGTISLADMGPGERKTCAAVGMAQVTDDYEKLFWYLNRYYFLSRYWEQQDYYSIFKINYDNGLSDRDMRWDNLQQIYKFLTTFDPYKLEMSLSLAAVQTQENFSGENCKPLSSLRNRKTESLFCASRVFQSDGEELADDPLLEFSYRYGNWSWDNYGTLSPVVPTTPIFKANHYWYDEIMNERLVKRNVFDYTGDETTKGTTFNFHKEREIPEFHRLEKVNTPSPTDPYFDPVYGSAFSEKPIFKANHYWYEDIMNERLVKRNIFDETTAGSTFNFHKVHEIPVTLDNGFYNYHKFHRLEKVNTPSPTDPYFEPVYGSAFSENPLQRIKNHFPFEVGSGLILEKKLVGLLVYQPGVWLNISTIYEWAHPYEGGSPKLSCRFVILCTTLLISFNFIAHL